LFKRGRGSKIELVSEHAGFDGGEGQLEFTGGVRFHIIVTPGYLIHELVLPVAMIYV
jgi:hypothetical protein